MGLGRRAPREPARDRFPYHSPCGANVPHDPGLPGWGTMTWAERIETAEHYVSSDSEFCPHDWAVTLLEKTVLDAFYAGALVPRGSEAAALAAELSRSFEEVGLVQPNGRPCADCGQLPQVPPPSRSLNMTDTSIPAETVEALLADEGRFRAAIEAGARASGFVARNGGRADAIEAACFAGFLRAILAAPGADTDAPPPRPTLRELMERAIELKSGNKRLALKYDPADPASRQWRAEAGDAEVPSEDTYEVEGWGATPVAALEALLKAIESPRSRRKRKSKS